MEVWQFLYGSLSLFTNNTRVKGCVVDIWMFVEERGQAAGNLSFCVSLLLSVGVNDKYV